MNERLRVKNRRFLDDFGEGMRQALRHLERKPRSKQEMLEKLLLKGFSASVANDVLQKLEAQSLIDDHAYAIRYAEEIIRKGYGLCKVRFKLSAKGVSREIIDQVVSKLQYEEKQGAILALRKVFTYEDPDGESTMKKMRAYLSKRGFSENAIREAPIEVMLDRD